MTQAVIFPSYWGPKGGDPILARNALEVQEGWVQHEGRYNVQTGQWEPRDPLDHDGDGKKGGSTSAVADLKALRAEYRKKMGKNAFNGWDAGEIRKRMA